MGSAAAAGSGTTYTLTPAALNVNEGSALTFTVGGTNITNGTYYWSVDAGSGDVSTTSGSFTITGNSGTFSVTPTADATTEGTETFIVYLRSGSISGTVLASETITINDTSFALGQYVFNGTPTDWAYTNSYTATYGGYVYPDNSSGSVHTLTGTQYVLSPGFTSSATICLNLWFYPTANNKVIMAELGQPAENQDFHWSVLEINSSNKLKGRVWEMGGVFNQPEVTSTGNVNLNAWNHVYLYFNNATSTFGMSLNNETPVTQDSVNRNISNTGTYWGIGLTDSQNMGSSARYQGKFDGLVISTTLTGSNFDATKAKYNRVTLTSGEALGFNGTDNRHVIVADNLADWNLGDTWCIEWWQKIPSGASGFLSVLCQDANVPTYSGIDVFINNGNIQMFNGGRQMSEADAPRDQWNHIAIRNNGGLLGAYINGVSQMFGGSHSGTIAPSSPLNLVIGSRTADGGANFYDQYFKGQIANIRISSVARYTSSSGVFTPPTTVVTDQYTKLSLDGSSGGDGMLTDETARHTLTNNGATIDTIV